ncbi:hypothetical protein K6U06_20385 [Acidiferrimicrobium sp. IK]|uniref:hypothetical protein n=1 Tax=Acidiferrimicrobium sp. IK TaxID=2871700 RepID=UPI0021CB5389|nr:hypothetical protein [Acidiferrimicrobium sp. IK]MCU4186734.1 hypothetical protein [Acidiferrimicrobium sp. IK]
MSFLEVVAAVAVVLVVIGRQLRGENLAGKRLVVLPAILVLIGVRGVAGHGHGPATTDIVLIGAQALVAAGVGVAQGRMMRLEERDGGLWGQMPWRSLWLWLGLVGSRLALDLVASGLGAEVAASSAPILLTLGINRLTQAAVVAPRALAAGISLSSEAASPLAPRRRR